MITITYFEFPYRVDKAGKPEFFIGKNRLQEHKAGLWASLARKPKLSCYQKWLRNIAGKVYSVYLVQTDRFTISINRYGIFLKTDMNPVCVYPSRLYRQKIYRTEVRMARRVTGFLINK